MIFEKRGMICNQNTFPDISWYKKNIMKPVAYGIDQQRIRLYVTLCDEDNVGRIGYIDINADDPKDILDYSRDPCINIGEEGKFDSHGCVSACIYEENDIMYMYYSGYNRHQDVPYTILTGCAVCRDNERVQFDKINDGNAILAPTQHEKYFRANPYVLMADGKYCMWYIGGNDWIELDGARKPLYNAKYIQTENKLQWEDDFPEVSMDLPDNKDVTGYSIGTIWRDDPKYKMILSIRYLSKGYRLGYAESIDGIHFTLRENEILLRGKNMEWDREMQCFPYLYTQKNKTYLFYVGNHYGIGGLGYAELIER